MAANIFAQPSHHKKASFVPYTLLMSRNLKRELSEMMMMVNLMAIMMMMVMLKLMILIMVIMITRMLMMVIMTVTLLKVQL